MAGATWQERVGWPGLLLLCSLDEELGAGELGVPTSLEMTGFYCHQLCYEGS